MTNREKEGSQMMTEDDILKEELMKGIDLILEAEEAEEEGEEQAEQQTDDADGNQVDDNEKRLEEEQEKLKKIKPIPVYKQLAGLPNLGKVFFINESELKNKEDWTQTQMTNLYGAELYGSSAQAAAQNGDGEGRDIGERSSLITCKVSTLMNLPSKGFVKEANNYGEKDFKTAMGEFAQALEKLKKDGKISAEHYESVHNIAKNFNYNLDSSERQNEKAWNDLTKLFKNEPWRGMNNQKNSEFQKAYLALRNYYNQWETGGASGSDSGFFGGGTGLKTKSSTLWNNLGTCRIDISTHFDENWYKRKFKSGMLNKMIYAIKTDAMKNAPPGVQANDTNKFGHKWSADTMEENEKRKLDSIRWKMTNKVANDYIRLLLGWTRKKEMYMEDGNYKPMQEVGDMTRDDAFGKEMAKKALSNRGILGRLKQKLFSGQQSSNTISVAFQMADFGDGWELVELRGDNEVGGEAAPEDNKKQEKEEQPKKKEEIAAESITQEYVSNLIDECLCEMGK